MYAVLRGVRRALVGVGLGWSLLHLQAEPVRAQWSTVHEQFYLPASHNWAFRKSYRAADRLFNAFDYGHAILYEELYTRPGAPVGRLEQKQYDFITRTLLVRPPRLPLEESAVEIGYAKLVPEVKAMFEWAHVLHRQMYDVWADESIALPDKDAHVAELLRYYRSRASVAFSTVPKSMELMEGQYYSRVFRERYPKFNGLIWAYHWLQVALYEPLLTGRDVDARQTGVLAAVARFWQMLEQPPASFPRVMPMTAAVSPVFAARYPEVAIVFDNLHALHDVISDILASPQVPAARKRAEILRAAARYRDDSSFTMTMAEWRDMATMMGVHNMGGAALDTALLARRPEPTLPLGATHADAMRVGGHAGHGTVTSAAAADTTSMRQLMDLYLRMMADSVIRRRLVTDTSMRRLVDEVIERMPPEHREHLREMMRRSNAPPARPPTRRPAPKPPDPHAGHRPPG